MLCGCSMHTLLFSFLVQASIDFDMFLLILYVYTIFPKVLAHSLLMKGLTTLVISMRTNLNV